ncbi:MAG: hypothetical protein II220_04510 [Spirochaetales bacterium]|nr:hypothetical protein [Spirochaetales bacterium]
MTKKCIPANAHNEVVVGENAIDLFESVNNGQFVILADCADGQVIIGKDGKFGFDDFNHAVFIRDEHRFSSVEVDVYLVQKSMDENGVIKNELIKCVAHGE